MAERAILWRRLDTPGHDGCRLEQHDKGWRLEGAATFHHERVPAALAYHVVCDATWSTQNGRVTGWLGDQTIDLAVERTPDGVWTLNGAALPALDDCVDLDLGFTPATNLLPIRRLALAAGEAADAPAAWLDLATRTLDRLPQRYERRGSTDYWYEASSVGYAALLEFTSAGFVRRYPDLWVEEAR